MEAPTTSLLFTVRRCKPELVAPAKLTPHEFKQLSDIDDQEGLRFQIPVIQIYRSNPIPSVHGNKDPVEVIREALSQTLVFYYPFACSLREGPGRKLVVECTAEGVMFIEADADVTLQQFGDAYLQPPFTCMEELLFVGPGSGGVLNCPLLLIQCEYEEVVDTKGTIIPLDDMVHCSFFFDPSEVFALRRFMPHHLSQCTTFELLTACLWHCCTIVLQPDHNKEVRIICIVNAHAKFDPRLPTGYYGNGFAFPMAVSTAEKLCENPLSYALESVKKAKNNITEEYMRSVADLLVIRSRPHFTVVRSYLVSDVTRYGFREVDFGWGKAAYGGPAKGGVGPIPGMASFNIPYKNSKGVDGIVLPICLPAPAMKRFVEELDYLLTKNPISCL